MKIFKEIFIILISIIFFVFIYTNINTNIGKYILLLFLLPMLLFISYRYKNIFITSSFSLFTILFSFIVFGINLFSITILIIFSLIVPVLYFSFPPTISENYKLSKKNNELKFYKEELLNEEKYLEIEKKNLEKNLEKIINFYTISKDLINNFTNSETAANALLNIIKNQNGILDIIIVSNENANSNSKNLKILTKLKKDNNEEWNKKIIEYKEDISKLRTPVLVNYLSSTEEDNIIAWPIIINNKLVVCIFIVVEKQYIQEIIEEGKFYIPHLQLGTKRILLFLQIKEKSRVDALTGLYLRRYFLEKLNIELKRAKRYKTSFHILMIDIDFFKKVNDTYGHLTGDTVLVEVSKKIKEHIKQTDILCRYGGEEFILLLNNLADNEVIEVAQSIRKDVKQLKFNSNNIIFSVTISIGIETYKKKITCDEIIANADKALYQAKNSGRNKVIFFQDTLL